MLKFLLSIFGLLLVVAAADNQFVKRVSVDHETAFKLADAFNKDKYYSVSYFAPFKVLNGFETDQESIVKLILAPTKCPKTEYSYGKFKRLSRKTFFDCVYNDDQKFVIVDAQKMKNQPDWRIVSHTQTDFSTEFLENLDHKLLGDDDSSISYSKAFEVFAKHHRKNYKKDYERRKAIFKSNMQLAKVIQAMDQGTAIYGATQFADLTQDEFRKRYLGLKASPREDNQPYYASENAAPDTFDWTKLGAVTPVKDQGGCGSCWAFSVTGNIEGQWFLARKSLESLSEQQLVDCDKIDHGCNGGLPSQAYDEIIRMGGLDNETAYPYKGMDGKCHYNPSDASVKISGSVNITSDEKGIKEWLFKNGPISAGLNAITLQFYFGGVSHPPRAFCSPQSLDHGVLIVGYGVHKTFFLHRKIPYWLVKNSWGSGWGEKGYFRMYRGDGTCGINTLCTSAKI